MTTDDLRKRAREAAEERLRSTQFPTYTDTGREVARAIVNTFVGGALWHAAQQPTREQIAEVIASDGWTCTMHEPVEVGECEECSTLQMQTANRIIALLNGEEE